jgi:hypothetical protein
LRGVKSLQLNDRLASLADVKVDWGVTEVAKEWNFVVDGQPETRKAVEIPVTLQFPGEGIKNLSIKVARGAIMLEDFDDAAGLSNLRVLNDLLFKVGSAYFLDIGGLLDFLALIKVLELTIEELFN